jgi:wyosine [tRNA(Phe)-imidazoG37] synthetase (radical SAM superfamily)
VDIAFSGDGEPTTSQAFSACIDVVHDVLIQFKLLHQIVVRVISNGSQMHRPHVLSAVKKLSAMNGEVWFKLDAGTATDILRINDVNLQPEQHLSKLLKCATYCPTWIQTCVFKYHGYLPTEDHLNAYLACLKKVQHQIQGVLLYGVARASFQSEAPWIEQLDNSELSSIAKRIEALGIQVKVSA